MSLWPVVKAEWAASTFPPIFLLLRGRNIVALLALSLGRAVARHWPRWGKPTFRGTPGQIYALNDRVYSYCSRRRRIMRKTRQWRLSRQSPPSF
jgi:hypothetical protein